MPLTDQQRWRLLPHEIEEVHFETLDTDGSYTRIDTTHLEQAIMRAQKMLTEANGKEPKP